MSFAQLRTHTAHCSPVLIAPFDQFIAHRLQGLSAFFSLRPRDQHDGNARILVAIHSGISVKPTLLSRYAQTQVDFAPLRAGTAHIVQLGTISLIG
jgi:hypothetical protein